MNYILTLSILLVFCLIAYQIGHQVGYKKGAERIIEEWRAWINDVEEKSDIYGGK